MDATVHSSLAAWESFYIIVGSSAGALNGLRFAAASLLLVFVGIHNAWDAVAYVAVVDKGRDAGKPKRRRQR